MLIKLIQSTQKFRVWILFMFGIAAIAGLHFLTTLPIDAVPDITPVQVVVNTKTAALDPEQIEKTVSFPIETEMMGLAGVQDVRSLSKYGLSQVVIIFKDGTDIYWARQQVTERLQNVRDHLPQGLAPELAPITTGLGEVLMYVVKAKPETELAKKGLQDQLLYLRTIQDFVIRRQLKTTIPNIAEVDSTGGYKKEIHIDVDPRKLEQQGLSIENVIEKVKTIGESVGGGYIQSKGEQIIVRAFSAIQSLKDIELLTIKVDVRGKPIRLKSVANVRDDFVQRLGAATHKGEEAVLGTVLMLSGANSRRVAMDTEKTLREMELPSDVEIETVYSRSFLVDATIRTVAKNLAEGAALVVVILLLLLGNLRAALTVSLAIPLSMLFAAIGMRYFGISANLMSLGAIDFGLLVDASVVIVENVLRRLEERNQEISVSDRKRIVMDSVREVVTPVSTGLVLIMAVYIPILTLSGIEGKLFRPMAQTVLMALGSSLVVGLFLMPILCVMILRGHRGEKKDTIVFRLLRKLYEPLLLFSLRRRWLVVAPIALIGLLSIWLYTRMGADFMPPLNEGDLVINLTRDNRIALDESVRIQKESDRIILKSSEVQTVFSRIGTPESATDPMGVHLSDTFVILNKNADTLASKDRLFDQLHKAIEREVPGQEVMQNQPIEMRFNEILEGSRADVTLRVYGKELDTLASLLDQAQENLEKIPGASEVELDALTALRKSPVLSIQLDHEQIARYGIHVEEVHDLLGSAMAGHEVGSLYEEYWRFPIVVRLTEEYRENPAELVRLPIGLPDGGTVPLGKLARIEQKEQVTTIAHAGGARYAAVSINLAGRDTESFVKEAKANLARTLELPAGYSLWWGGQFKNLDQARAQLRVIVPLILFVIFLVLLRSFGSFAQTALVYLSIPLAMTGGVFSLYLRQIPFSISAAVGFIALCGIAILNSMVLVTFFNQLRKEGTTISDAVTRGALIRLRPVLMTALVASLGFLPMAFNTGIGAEVQRPLATVVIGGLITSTLLTLVLLPTLYLWIESKRE